MFKLGYNSYGRESGQGWGIWERMTKDGMGRLDKGRQENGRREEKSWGDGTVWLVKMMKSSVAAIWTRTAATEILQWGFCGTCRAIVLKDLKDWYPRYETGSLSPRQGSFGDTDEKREHEELDCKQTFWYVHQSGSVSTFGAFLLARPIEHPSGKEFFSIFFQYRPTSSLS